MDSLKEMVEEKLKAVEPNEPGEPKEYKDVPHLTFSSDQLEEVKDWETGDEYYIVLKVKQTDRHEDEDGKVTANFEVTEAGALDDDDDEEDNGDEETE